MSKSYTLADGSTVTVTSTENGVPFNEGMQALTKAIKARVAVRDGSGTGGGTMVDGKPVPILKLSRSYFEAGDGGTATVTYTGDSPYFIDDNYSRTLYFANTSMFTVQSSAGSYNSFIYTPSTNNYAAAIYEYSYVD